MTPTAVPVRGGPLPVRDLASGDRRLRDLGRFLDELRLASAAEPELAEAAKAMELSVRNLLTRLRDEILDLEKRVGCSHCGARDGQDCRLDSEIGYCPSAEDARAL